MRILKRLMISLMLICLCCVVYPATGVKAAEEVPPDNTKSTRDSYERSVGSFSEGSVDKNTGKNKEVQVVKELDYEVKGYAWVMLPSGYDKVPVTIKVSGKAKNIGEALGLIDEAISDKKWELLTIYESEGMYNVTFDWEDPVCIKNIKTSVKMSEVTRHYGYTAYAGEVTITKSSPDKITVDDVRTAMANTNPTYYEIGIGDIGGQDDSRPLAGATAIGKELSEKIIAYPDFAPLEQFKAAFGDYFGIDNKLTVMDSQLKSVSKTVTAPFVCATLVMSAGTDGAPADVIRGHLNPYNMTFEQGMNYFSKCDGKSLLDGIIAGNANLSVSTSAPVFSKYVFPLLVAEPYDSDFIFGVESNPQDAPTNWADDNITRVGTFKVNVMAKSSEGIDPDSIYTVSVGAVPVNEQYDGPFCVATPVKIESASSAVPLSEIKKEVFGKELIKEKPTFITFNVIGGSPQNPGDNILNKGVLKINVTVQAKSGIDQKVKSATYYPELSDKFAKGVAGGEFGYNYVGWRHKIVPTIQPDVDIIPWAHHSAETPLVNGTLGASEYGNEDWDTGVGIPSTENVYVLAGGETAVSDLAGYFVMHSSNGNGGYSTLSTNGQGDNERGNGSGTASVTREILVSCAVQNTWGLNNTVCHRQATGYSASGGCSNYTGGGNPFSCSGGDSGTHSGSHSAWHTGNWNSGYNHCADSHDLGDQFDVVKWNKCNIHGTAWSKGTGEEDYEHHNTCGALTDCNADYDEKNQKIGGDSTCGSDTPNSCSPQTVHHDCTWNLTVYDGDRHDKVNVENAASPIDLPTFTITANGGLLSQGLSCFTISGAGTEWIDRVITTSVGCATCCNARVTGSMKFTPAHNQYFTLSGTFTVTQQNDVKHPHTSGCPHFTSGWTDDTVSGGTKEEVNLVGGNGSSLLCNGYSYGTGTGCDGYENCYHNKEHKYSLKYNERIDFYVFRTITDAHLAAMKGSNLTGVNEVTRSGYGDTDGTFAAPIDSSAVGQSVTAPTSVGYLWRCINNKYGSYVNGEGLATDNGEYNGRILFEIWKNPEVGGGGAISYEFNPNFCLGNAEIKAVLTQDSKFGNSPEVASQLNPTVALEALPENIANRGSTDNRFNHGHVTSDERGKGRSAKYASAKGDCVNGSWSADSVWEATDEIDLSEYKNVVIAEQNAVINYWQGQNKDDHYHANIISDSLIYGSKTMTTQVVGEYYSVDEGIPLFNYLAGTGHRTEIKGEEGPVFRNHHSLVGSTKEELAEFILNYHSPTARAMDDGDHYGYFGFGGEGDGGDTILTESLTGMCVEGIVYEIENGNKGGWIPPGDAIDAYKRKLGANAKYPATGNLSGITEFRSYQPSIPTAGGITFAGYWNDHTYEGLVPETIGGECNMSSGQSEDFQDVPNFEFTGTNSGTINQQQYGQSLLMHNLPLVDWTPNGFWPTVSISTAYGWLLSIESNFSDVKNKLVENGVYDKHKQVVSTGLPYAIPETVRIYDPISAENSINIGNQYGNFSGDRMSTPDESEYDQRITSIGKDKNDFAAIGNYVNTNTYLWTWLAPFGNFSSVGGGSSPGADITTAEVYRNAGNRGFVDDMYIGTWTKTVKINYPFIGKAKNNNKVSQEFFIDELDSVYGGGNSNYMESKYGSDVLQNFYEGTGHDDPVFKFGNAVGAKNTVNLREGVNLPVVVTAYAINDGLQEGDNSAIRGESVNGNGNNSDTWCNAASYTIPIDLVGQIGNLAIHDTTDFRFSTYFKQPIENSWLIDGVILNTNEKLPIHILAEPKDILFQDAEGKVYKHATLGITDMNAPFGKNKGRGMAGDYGLLPLTPAYITVPEFKTDALRLGYKVFASIETIGNYQAAHQKGVKYPTNYDQAQDQSNDTRTEYMDITSEYYLYDFDDGRFYAIDLWSGPEGAKQCIYSGSDRKVHAQENSEPLYINMDEEFYRRNVSDLEESLSKSKFTGDIDTYESKVYTAVMSGLEFIGYTGNIRLDTMDLTYCGSDAVQGIEGYNTGDNDIFNEYSDTSQRWHFTTGLTTTTTPTMPIYTDGSKPTATQVENAYRDLRNKHPHSVIVEFQNYIAKGYVWTLKYKGSLMNTDTIQFYTTEEDCPYEEKDYIKVQYKGKDSSGNEIITPVYNPATGDPYGTQVIDKDSTPLVAYEAYKSNAEDRTTAGTH